MNKIFAYTLFLFIFFFPFIFLNIFSIISFKNYLLFLISEIIFLEVFFNLLLISSEKFKLKIKFKKKGYYYASHPYLPYTLTPNERTAEREKTNYALQKKEYFFPSLEVNSLGFLNGKRGNRNFKKKKSQNSYVIGCVGNSTTLNYIEYKKKIYSYPLILETLLRKKYKRKKIFVNNFGVGLYNSTDILIRFILQILDLKPDLVILYLGHNDHEAYLSEKFKDDYSHIRKNLAENLWRIDLTKKISKLKIKSLTFLIQHILGTNLRNTLNNFISTKNINYKTNHKNKMKTFARNVTTLIKICKSNNIKVILSSYAYYLHKKIKKNPKYKKIQKIIKDENIIMKKISKETKTDFVDNQNLIEKNEKNFLDDQHFTPEGMQKLSENFLKKIRIN